MQAKIEWFKEILELDPSSKVFFPLAKMLADAGQTHEALELVREGVARHPDFLEARFYALELCARLGDDEAVAEEAGYIGDILGKYPLFWKAWAQNLARKPETRDAALALDFVSVHFKGAPVSWGEVIQRGLEGLFHHHQTTLPFSGETDSFLHRPQAGPVAAAQAPQAVAAPQRPVEQEPLLEAEQDATTMAPSALKALAESVEMTAPAPAPSHLPRTEALPEPQHEVAAPAGKSGIQSSEEVYSIRTRTMARLLAEQGDYDGALEIYRELLAKADDDAEREELDAIIERMQLMLRDGSAVAPAPAAAPSLSLQLPGRAEPPGQAEATLAPVATVSPAKASLAVVPIEHVPAELDSSVSMDPSSIGLDAASPASEVEHAVAALQKADSVQGDEIAVGSDRGAAMAVSIEPPSAANVPPVMQTVAQSAAQPVAPPRAQKSSRSALERLALRLERRAAR